MLSPAELRQRLADLGDLPGFGARPRRPGPGRARWSSLGAALRWSTDSLTPPQRTAFQRLAMLPDSFSLAAARSVCDLDDDGALEALDALVRKSLLESVPAARSVRFRMLDTVRRHAASGLAEDPVASTAAREGLLRWAVEEAERYRQRADAHGHRVAMDAVEQEQHNMRAALDWAAGGGAAVQGVAVLCGTEDWWRAAGHTAEGWERLRTLLDRAVDHEVPERTWLHGVTCLVVFAAFLDDAAQAVSAELLGRVERRLEHVPDPELRLRLATELAWVRLDLSDAGGGIRFVELLAESRRLGGLMESSLLHYFAIWQLTNDEPAAALASARACAVSAAAVGNDVSQAHSAELLGMVLTTNACPDEARAHLLDALDAMVAVDHLGCVVHCIESIAWWATSVARLEEARRLLGHADGLRRSLRRSRFSVERYAYEAALARCGEPTPSGGADLIGDALALAAELLTTQGPAGPATSTPGDASAAPARRLSRPAWMHSPPPPAGAAG